MTAESRLPGAVPCTDRANHRPQNPQACPWCRSTAMVQPGADMLVVRTLWTCPRGHRGQLDGWPCTVCVGESKNPGPPPAGPTPVRARRSGICEHGLKIRRGASGLLACQLCRRATTEPDSTPERTRP